MSQARARTRSARSGVERTNHEATVPKLLAILIKNTIIRDPVLSDVPKCVISIAGFRPGFRVLPALLALAFILREVRDICSVRITVQ